MNINASDTLPAPPLNDDELPTQPYLPAAEPIRLRTWEEIEAEHVNRELAAVEWTK